MRANNCLQILVERLFRTAGGVAARRQQREEPVGICRGRRSKKRRRPGRVSRVVCTDACITVGMKKGAEKQRKQQKSKQRLGDHVSARVKRRATLTAQTAASLFRRASAQGEQRGDAAVTLTAALLRR